MMGRIGIIIALFIYVCPLGQPNFIGDYWISSKSFWDCETIEDPSLCGFKILYFQDDTTFYLVSGIHRIDTETDSISYRVEPGINKYKGRYSVQKGKVTFSYRQTYGTFFTDTSLVNNEFILKKRKHRHFLTSGLQDYEPTMLITDYSKRMIQNDIHGVE
jgi:hypothetical protein